MIKSRPLAYTLPLALLFLNLAWLFYFSCNQWLNDLPIMIFPNAKGVESFSSDFNYLFNAFAQLITLLLCLSLLKKGAFDFTSWGLTIERLKSEFLIALPFLLGGLGISILIINNAFDLKTQFFNATTLPFHTFVTAIIFMGIFGPIIEEILYRGILYSAISNMFKSQTLFTTGLSVLISSYLFAKIHAPDLSLFNPMQMGLPFICGIIGAILFQWRKSLIAPILIHIGANTMILLVTQF